MFRVPRVSNIKVPLLGGSWAVVSGVICPLIWVVSLFALLVILFITTHGPPSKGSIRDL